MNFALQELAILLPAIPPSPTVAGKEKGTSASPSLKAGDKGASTPASSFGPGGAAASKDANSSKASTVEMAIEFIKELQGELGDVRGRLAAAEQALGRPLESMEKSTASIKAAEQEPAASKNEAMQDAAVQAGSKKGRDG
jgi:Helix-loop-helix DNA-binding domain